MCGMTWVWKGKGWDKQKKVDDGGKNRFGRQ